MSAQGSGQMTNTRIALALGNLFDKQRVVFWYDAQREFRADFEALELPGVEKIELANNEFGVKHRVLRALPELEPIWKTLSAVVSTPVRRLTTPAAAAWTSSPFIHATVAPATRKRSVQSLRRSVISSDVGSWASSGIDGLLAAVIVRFRARSSEQRSLPRGASRIYPPRTSRGRRLSGVRA